MLSGKKILIIVENLPSPFDRRVWQEACALRDAGATVSIICPKGKGYTASFETIDDIAIYRHALPIEADNPLEYLIEYGIALFWEFFLACKVLVTRGFDAIHACNPPDLIFLVALPFKLLEKEFLFDHHDINPELYIAKFNRKDIFYRLMLLLERLTFASASVCISTNASYRHIAITRGKKKPEHVFTVRSGPSLDRLKIKTPTPALKKGRPILVGYVGVMGKQEGLDYLIDACAYIVHTKRRQDIHFICVGGGTERTVLQHYATQKNVSAFMDFPGRVSDEQLLDALNTADICVNPDTYNAMNDKSTMNKIMEYMALKKPIVQFDLTEGRASAQEASLYAKHNDAVDMAEKILWLADHPEERCRMGDIGYRRITETLEWKYEKKHLYDAYRTLFQIDTH